MSQHGLNEAISAVTRMRRRADPIQLAQDIKAVGEIKSNEKSNRDLHEAVKASIRLGSKKKK